MEVLKLNHIAKRFGKQQVLHNLSLSLNKGELACLLGSSGSGKSTLLRLIAGLDAPDSGSIVLNGNVVVGDKIYVKPELRKIGMIFQDYALFPHLTIKQNIEFGLKDKQAGKETVAHLSKVLGIEELWSRYPHQISGGQQQRVAIARALAVNPTLLLMDEPFSNLDEWMKEEVRDELKSILQKLNATVLFVTHNAMDALSFADKIMVMDKGEIVQNGTPVQIIDEPVSSKIAGIFGKVNVFDSDELKHLFGLQKAEGNYFIKPEHFALTGANADWEVMEVAYHGNYFDANVKKKNRLIHVHLNKPIQQGEHIALMPLETKVYIEQK